MKPTTPSLTPALLDRCHEIAQQEATPRESVRLRQGFDEERGAAGEVRRHRLGEWSE